MATSPLQVRTYVHVHHSNNNLENIQKLNAIATLSVVPKRRSAENQYYLPMCLIGGIGDEREYIQS